MANLTQLRTNEVDVNSYSIFKVLVLKCELLLRKQVYKIAQAAYGPCQTKSSAAAENVAHHKQQNIRGSKSDCSSSKNNAISCILFCARAMP